MTDDTPIPDEHLLPIREICEGEVRFMVDGQRRLIYMQGLRLMVNGTPRTVDAVLCLNHSNPTYPTRLYFAEQLGCGLNWHESAFLLGRTWYTFSWSNVASNQSPIEILAAHLRPLERGRAA
jgi:hypothetical protein